MPYIPSGMGDLFRIYSLPSPIPAKRSFSGSGCISPHTDERETKVIILLIRVRNDMPHLREDQLHHRKTDSGCGTGDTEYRPLINDTCCGPR